MHPSPRSPAVRVWATCGLAALYVIVARLGLAMDAVSGFATLVWPPTGLSLAALLVLDGRAWPGVTVGAFVVNVWTGAPAPVALGIAAGNTLEAVAGAWAIRRFTGFRPALDRLGDAIALVGIGALASTVLSATVGVASLVAGGITTLAEAGRTWRAWWLGDAIGDLVVAPVLLTLSAAGRIPRGLLRPARVAEVVALGSAILAGSIWLFGVRVGGTIAAFREAYLIFPLLVWAAVRFGSRGAALATFAVSAVAVAGTALGRGPFTRTRLSESLLFLQVFVAIAATTAIILGAVAQERAQALALRDSLLSVASHELRTPLAALQLRVQALARAVAKGAAARERIAADATALDRQVKRLATLVDELLDMSRIMSGRIRMEPEDVDLGLLVEEVVERCEPDDRARVQVRLPPERVVGRWDRSRVDQVISNLVSNAIKYGAQGPVEITLGRFAERARVAVSDRGIGIPPEDLGRIFERFERGRTAKGTGGFGVGLWMVAQVLAALGGTVEVESVVGKGSTFVVELPMHEAGST